MTPRDLEEYRALRATIRERGTARMCIVVLGVAAWAGVLAATAALSPTPLAVLLPLTLLAVVFEAVLALHAGVERIGRYLQVFHEADGTGWEHAAMEFRRPRGAIGVDPLFSVMFVLATIVNIAPSFVLDPTRSELAFVAGPHVLFVLRLLMARAAAARQRAVDLERFQQLKQGPRG